MQLSSIKSGKSGKSGKATKPGQDHEVTIHVKGESNSFSLMKATTIIAVTVVFGAVIAAWAYGAATGDYSALQDIAKHGQNVVKALGSLAATK